MKIYRRAQANWKGTGMEGQGSLTTQSKILDETQYSFKTRFEEGKGTNPEELIAAAHAGCYTMQLSFLLTEAGYNPTNLDTKAKLLLEDGTISKIELSLEAEIPEISNEEFQNIAKKAKEICPVSKLLNAEIILESTLK